MVAFALNYAAYFAGSSAPASSPVDRGHYEGSKVLGMSYLQTMRRIVLPPDGAARAAAIGGETITLVKDTSLIYVRRSTTSCAPRAASCRRLRHHAVPGRRAFYLIVTLILTWFFRLRWKRYAKYDQ